ncbi:MAG TPA: PIN domain-containing protein [Roseiflexaceae bacterium]|nr:PIN domain-containing protein [Roseiflexaceae bacterium]
MKVSLNFLVRIIGMVVLASLGYWVGSSLSGSTSNETQQQATLLLILSGAGLGLLTTHRWTIEPLQEGLRYLNRISVSELTTLALGVLLGLIFALMLAVPLGYLPAPLGQFAPIVGAVVLSYLGAMILATRRKDLVGLVQSARRPALVLPDGVSGGGAPPLRYLVDTSAIVDGRVANVAQAGFIAGTLLVPRFVLTELQTLADSADELRRGKGRRGLEILNAMQKEASPPVEVLDVDVDGTPQVDDKLIVLARQYHCPIITNDYNLGRVAGLQGVKVLNLNQLADSVRPPVVPGQSIDVTIRDVGRERDQGISFLEDGTMIVVEDARRLVGQQVAATVTRVFQTQTGRIVFAQLNSDRNGRPQGSNGAAKG